LASSYSYKPIHIEYPIHSNIKQEQSARTQTLHRTNPQTQTTCVVSPSEEINRVTACPCCVVLNAKGASNKLIQEITLTMSPFCVVLNANGASNKLIQEITLTMFPVQPQPTKTTQKILFERFIIPL
jgi:hypothetical protein